MPISVAVAGEGAPELAEALRAAGSDAAATDAPAGQDLAILLADPAQAGDPAMRTLVGALTESTDRILFVPRDGTGDLAAVTAWFELFAERGFQPVMEYDAGFLGQGAFLADRNAVAAETELAEFADRLAPVESAPPPRPDPSPPDPSPPEPARPSGDEAALLRTQLAAAQAELAALRQALEQARAETKAWAPLREWVDAAVRRIVAPARPKRSLFGFLSARRRRAVRLAEDASSIRRSDLFDPSWYVASHPELARTGADPVLHYLAQHGTADPGPWFDTATYLRDHPELDPARMDPLLHAIKSQAKN